jgi:hypothetical protein
MKSGNRVMTSMRTGATRMEDGGFWHSARYQGIGARLGTIRQEVG